MLPQLTATEAESMDPQVYASLVSGEDYAEYAERTECDNRAFNERLSNCRTGELGSERQFDKVPNWRGFQDFGPPTEVGGFGGCGLTAANGLAA